nr:unnamed protein product [Callosobruchus analis]
MALMCFDMQSVLTCPQMQISKAYYKKKFAVYNLTGYDVVKKRGYCALWHELLGGRKAIDIASALYVILEKLLPEIPNVTTIILWSDSCLPQNKNCHMSAAILHFFQGTSFCEIYHAEISGARPQLRTRSGCHAQCFGPIFE